MKRDGESSCFQFRRFAGRDAQAAAAAAWLARAITRRRPAGKKRARVALAGGETPIAAYARLARLALPWSYIDFMPTDERCVPLAHARSNAGMLHKTLGVDKIILPLIEGDSAAAPSVILLGAGADGHVASLFAEADCDENTNAVLRIAACGAREERLSLPMRALRRAEDLLLMICGKEKLRMLQNTPQGKALTLAQLKNARRLRDFAGSGIHFGGGGRAPLSYLLAARTAAEEAAEIKNTGIYYAG